MVDLEALAASLGQTKYQGSSVRQGVGYHDIPVGEFKDIPSLRKGNAHRIEQIQSFYDTSGKVGLDIGCSVGGMSLGLADRGARLMVGVDYDSSAIELAQQVATLTGLACEFHQMKISSEEFWGLFDQHQFDFVLWLSNWMWISKQQGRPAALEHLGRVSEMVETLVFEVAQGPNDGPAGDHSLGEGAEGVSEALRRHTSYTTITDMGIPENKWHKRNVFLCQR